MQTCLTHIHLAWFFGPVQIHLHHYHWFSLVTLWNLNSSFQGHLHCIRVLHSLLPPTSSLLYVFTSLHFITATATGSYAGVEFTQTYMINLQKMSFFFMKNRWCVTSWAVKQISSLSWSINLSKISVGLFFTLCYKDFYWLEEPDYSPDLSN